MLTSKLCAVLVGILCGFLVGHPSNVEQAIDARPHGVCALVSKLERLFRICSVFVDHFVDQILDWSDIFEGTQLQGVSERSQWLERHSHLADVVQHARPGPSEGLEDWVH